MTYNSSTEKRRAVEERLQIQRSLQKRLDELEATKKQLSKQVRDLEKRVREPMVDLHRSRSILTDYMLHGYSLTNYSIAELDDSEKLYTAYCEDDGHPFKISVSMKGDEITKVDVTLPEHSPLHEIKNVLHVVSEDKCPHLVLVTIRQFIQLNNFRNQVTEKLLAYGSSCFSVYLPKFGKEKSLSSCMITARRGTIEILWTMVWDKVYHCLVHDFSSHSPSVVQNSLKKLWDQLLLRTFSDRNEDKRDLLNWWTEFSNTIASV